MEGSSSQIKSRALYCTLLENPAMIRSPLPIRWPHVRLQVPAILLAFSLGLAVTSVYGQINTGIVILNQEEQARFRDLLDDHAEVKALYDSIRARADTHLSLPANPIPVIYYEGLLDTDPDRVASVESLLDINRLIDMLYAGYGSDPEYYAPKIKEIVLAWARTYLPDGNTINEHKLTPLFWAYYLLRDAYSRGERSEVESWMYDIALQEMGRVRTPNNNWQSKRMKIVGLIGGILENATMRDFVLLGIKDYIGSSYFPDGTSVDLRHRDALSYHVSGIEPLLDIFINFRVFSDDFDLYGYTSPSGSSVEKAIAYVMPFVKGEKVHEEWVNTQVQLDKERAAAGLEKYQPGTLFQPEQAMPMLRWAIYYHPGYMPMVCPGQPDGACHIEAVLNGPVVRGRQQDP